jgi:DNA-binding beta-propeller fold protein YncE
MAITAAALVMAATAGTALASPSFGYLGQFGEPMLSGGINYNFLGAAVDPTSSDFYFTTGKYEQVFNFDSSGTLVNQYGGFAGSAGDGKFAVTDGVAVDPKTSDVYVTDDDNDRVEKFDSSGNFISQFGGPGAADGEFSWAEGVAVDPNTSDVYVVDQKNERLEKFDSSGDFLEAWGWGVADGASALEMCASSCQAGISGSGPGQFDSPNGVAVDPSTGNVYVADTENDRVEVFGSGGNLLGQFGTAGSGNGEFTDPEGLAVDPTTNDVYVTDTGNDRVEMFNSGGTYIGQFGTSGSGDAQFSDPLGVAVDPNTSDVYVVDALNNRVEKFGETGPLTLSGVPSNITTGATSTSGATVTYTPPTAGGGDASTPSVSCSPASGSLFPIGTTTVTCTATDSDGLVTPVSASFTVTVTRLATHLAVTPAKHGLFQLTFSATLTGVLGGAPLTSQTVAFSEQGHALCHAITSSQGVASCTISGFAFGPGTFTATYAGNTDYQATTATGEL